MENIAQNERITFALTDDDLADTANYAEQRLNASVSRWGALVFIVAVMFIFVFAAAAGPREGWNVVPLIAIFVVIIIIPAFAFFQKIPRTNPCDLPEAFFAPRTAILSSKGYLLIQEKSETFHRWEDIATISETEKQICFTLNPALHDATTYTVPKRAFDTPHAATAFYERATELRRESTR